VVTNRAAGRCKGVADEVVSGETPGLLAEIPTRN